MSEPLAQEPTVGSPESVSEFRAVRAYVSFPEITDVTCPSIEGAEVTPEPSHSLVNATKDATDDQVSQFAAQAVAGRNPVKDITTGAGWNEGKGMFGTRADRFRQAAPHVYRVYLHIVNDHDAAMEQIRRHSPFNERERAPKSGNDANIAMQLVTKPGSKKNSQFCSEASNAFIFAAMSGITLPDFPAWLEKHSIKDCIAAVRAAKAQQKTVACAQDVNQVESDVVEDTAPSNPEGSPQEETHNVADCGATPAKPVEVGPRPEMTVTFTGLGEAPRSIRCALKPKWAELIRRRVPGQTVSKTPDEVLSLLQLIFRPLKPTKIVRSHPSPGATALKKISQKTIAKNRPSSLSLRPAVEAAAEETRGRAVARRNVNRSQPLSRAAYRGLQR